MSKPEAPVLVLEHVPRETAEAIVASSEALTKFFLDLGRAIGEWARWLVDTFDRLGIPLERLPDPSSQRHGTRAQHPMTGAKMRVAGKRGRPETYHWIPAGPRPSVRA